MTSCSAERLEALVRDELTAPESAALQGHVAHCPRCRHELNWLESERALFRQRQAADDVGALWAELEAREARQRPRPQPQPARGFAQARRLAVSLAAMVVVLVGVSRALVVSAPADRLGEGWSARVASEVGTLESREAAGGTPLCSRLPDGVGFRCLVQASFVASR